MFTIASSTMTHAPSIQLNALVSLARPDGASGGRSEATSRALEESVDRPRSGRATVARPPSRTVQRLS